MGSAVMVGPSSSHTAGAVRIGLVLRAILGGPLRQAEIALHGSFAATGHGHATDHALVAGLMGRIRLPKYALVVQVPVRMDDGRV